MRLEAQAILGFVALSCGDARGAHRQIAAVVDQLSDKGVQAWGWMPLVFCELDALVEVGYRP